MRKKIPASVFVSFCPFCWTDSCVCGFLPGPNGRVELSAAQYSLIEPLLDGKSLPFSEFDRLAALFGSVVRMDDFPF